MFFKFMPRGLSGLLGDGEIKFDLEKIRTLGSVALLLSVLAACSTSPYRGEGSRSNEATESLRVPSDPRNEPTASLRSFTAERPLESLVNSSPIAGNSDSTPTVNRPNDGALATQQTGEEVALRAIALVGKPYRYGGADLDGFDCSGLVYFIYQQLGKEVPRTATQQQRAAKRVARSALTPGDLVFFKRTRGKAITHVGIYVGDNRFVHAPQSGKSIELRALDEQYFVSRWIAAGRFDY